MRVDRCPAGVIDRAWATEAAPIASETLAAGSPASVDRLVVRMSTVVSVSSHSPVEDLPEGARPAPDEHLADAAASLRTSVFTVGWLTPAWETMRAGIGADLDPEQRNRLATRQLVLTAESGEAGSALSNWAQGLQTKGVRSGQAGHIWQKCLAILSEDQGPDPRLTVVTPAGERRQVSAYCHDLTTGGSRSVVLDILGPVARSGPQSLTVPDQSWLSQWNDGLSPTMVLVETTNPIAPADFIYPDHDQSPSGPLAGMDYFNVGRDQTAPPAGAGSSSNGAPGDTPTGPESLSGPLEY